MFVRQILSLVLVLCFCLQAKAEDVVKVGMLKLVSSAPLFIGMEKGFFQQEGIKCEPIYFSSAQPISTALASKDLDVAATGITAGLYNLIGSKIKMRIVADKGREKQGFRLTAIMISNEEWQKGTKKLSQLRGAKIGVTQIGSTFHYILGRLLEMEGLSLGDVEVVPMGGLKNVMDAITSNQIQAGFVVQPYVSLMEENGKGKVLLWVSDKVNYQIAAIVYGEKMLSNNPLGTAFMRAYIKGTRYYYDNALLPVQENRVEKAEEIISIIEKYTGVNKELIRKGLNYNDPEGKLDLEDISTQLDWLYKQGLLKYNLKVEDVVDQTFIEGILKTSTKR